MNALRTPSRTAAKRFSVESLRLGRERPIFRSYCVAEPCNRERSLAARYHYTRPKLRVTRHIDRQSRQMASNTRPPFIVAFYDPQIQAKDGEGRTLDDILSFSDDQLEYYHDFVQYLFPLPERSPINPYAPTITEDVRAAFLARPDLQKELRRSLKRMLKFYGFDIDEEDSIVPGEYFDEDSKSTWRKRMDHNHLRITRIIRSLRVLGLVDDAAAFYQALLKYDGQNRVGSRTLEFWKRAAERQLHLSPQENDGNATGVQWLRGAAGPDDGANEVQKKDEMPAQSGTAAAQDTDESHHEEGGDDPESEKAKDDK